MRRRPGACARAPGLCIKARIPIGILCLFACSGTLARVLPDVAARSASVVAPAPSSSIATLAAINVTGVVPGPGLWKVSHGDHALWILGVVPTLPAAIQWQSAEVAQTIARSQTVIASPDVKLKVDTNWFGKLFLLLPVYNAQRNPDYEKLVDVLPPALYARWQVQKQRYFGDDRGIERYRPIIAASKLLKAALKANGLRSSGKVEGTIMALARQYDVKVVKPDTPLEVRHPHDAVKAFAQQGPEGIACFTQILDVVEHQLPALRARANAWATGDIDALRTLPGDNYRETCKSAITGAGFAKSLGIDNLPTEIENRWLGAAEAALASNTRSFALLPMHDLLDPQGYLAQLRARGYAVTPPPLEPAADDLDPVDARPAPGVSGPTPASAASAH